MYIIQGDQFEAEQANNYRRTVTYFTITINTKKRPTFYRGSAYLRHEDTVTATNRRPVPFSAAISSPKFLHIPQHANVENRVS